MGNDPTTIAIRDVFCIESLPDPCGLIIFGASGDLTSRKLVPSLFALYQKGLLPEGFFVLGCGRTAMSDDAFRARVRDALAHTGDRDGHQERFIGLCRYVCGAYDTDDLYQALSRRLKELEDMFHSPGNRLFYLSLPPAIYPGIVERLDAAKLTRETREGRPWRRVIIEKPFGYDLDSARDLNVKLHRHVNERQIYRIDHYLGKDTVQNLFIFRFANAVFEPIWDRRYIDHVQITVAESIGVEHRAGYFEHAGLLRDVFQNHMLQMLSLMAMEPPVRFEADRFRDETAKLLRSIKPYPENELEKYIVRGQYTEGRIADRAVPAYRAEEGVSGDSATETFVAAKLLIDNWRWQGVPFYLRCGKRLPRRASEIAIVFKVVPHSVFAPLEEEDLSRNVLVVNVQPAEGMALTIQAKRPGPRLCMGELTMSFKYRDVFGSEPPEAYEHLLLDAMLGDQTLFIRFDALEAAWQLLTPVLPAWEEPSPRARAGQLCFYPAGTWGPPEADALLTQDGRRWRKL